MFYKSINPVADHVPPLCVDMDGTLLKTDTLVEAVVRFLIANPLSIFQLISWLLKGRAHFKAEIAKRWVPTDDSLPANQDFLAYLKEQHDSGRSLVLATAANSRMAEAIHKFYPFFSAILASDADENCKGTKKAAALTKRFPHGFDYAGNSSADVLCWQAARQAIVVNASSHIIDRAKQVSEVTQVFDRPDSRLPTLIMAMRLHQWVKNLLIFVPLIMAHRINDPVLWARGGTAFLAFSLLASGVYLFNDFCDLDTDRRCPSKSKRPFASGALPLYWGFIFVPLCFVLGLLATALLDQSFLLALLVYLVLTFSYSFWLKRLALVDVLMLAGLYTWRIVAGALATEVLLSAWLLAFSVFLFFSLALLKRVSELVLMKMQNRDDYVGRGYTPSDGDHLYVFGVCSGYMSVLVFALYINSDQVRGLYQETAFLWLICPLLLYWVSRLWLIGKRGGMDLDPIIFAVKDGISYLVGSIILVILWVATLA